MRLDEAKEILKSNGYLLETRFGNGKDRFNNKINRLKLSDIDDTDDTVDTNEPITVDHIDEKNYKYYIGKFVNVKGNVKLDNLNLTELPIKFGKVGGHFYCYWNKLTTLEGAPTVVDGNFICDFNELTSLKGSPKKVKGCFKCSHNKLTSLEGAPEKIGDYFDCQNNLLTSLEGSPKIVRSSFLCNDNLLTTLKGAPKYVGKDFWVCHNKAKFTEDDVLDVSDVEDDIFGDVD